MKILVTGGAGFIGSHLVDALVAGGHEVVVLDNLDSQVHGQGRNPPRYLNPQAVFVEGDVRDVEAVNLVVRQVDAVYHFAAQTGVGQSMYQISRYVSVNELGTATLLEAIVNSGSRVQKLVLASSRAVYGEGAYWCDSCCRHMYPKSRLLGRSSANKWELDCPVCGKGMKPVPTGEDAELSPQSTYAVTKLAQESLSLCLGRALAFPVIALRFFNVYGPRQALRNPYTGILSIFANRVLHGQDIEVYEDGNESRDFVHVRDVVAACVLALENSSVLHDVINVGTGVGVSVLEVAQLISQKLGASCPPQVTGKYRVGDIRHCYADTGKAKHVLGFAAAISLRQGIDSFLQWVTEAEVGAEDRSEEAASELAAHGLLAA